MLVAALLCAGALLHGSGPAVSRVSGRAPAAQMSGAYDFTVRDLKSGDVTNLADYEGRVSLVVNVASK